MALNKSIVDKIKQKTENNDKLRTDLLNLLGKVEEGKQPKRVIDTIMSNLNK